MKKQYVKPEAEHIEFSYKEQVVASDSRTCYEWGDLNSDQNCSTKHETAYVV